MTVPDPQPTPGGGTPWPDDESWGVDVLYRDFAGDEMQVEDSHQFPGGIVVEASSVVVKPEHLPEFLRRLAALCGFEVSPVRSTTVRVLWHEAITGGRLDPETGQPFEGCLRSLSAGALKVWSLAADSEETVHTAVAPDGTVAVTRQEQG